MPVNRNALIRYRTIDKCLQNRYRRWTLEDLIDACSESLYEYEGIDSGVSRRTIQADIQMMRSDKLGYNAPITVQERKYYVYEDQHYSITNIPISEQDLGMLSEAVEFMKQFQGFSHFSELDMMVQKLEDHVYSKKTKTKPVIDIEKNENLKGLGFLTPLYKDIINKRTVKIHYQSFKARASSTFIFNPYLLKEYRNRWFVVGSENKRSHVIMLALDRIITLEMSDVPFTENVAFDPETYFQHVLGVTTSPGLGPLTVTFWVNRTHAPYVVTKPLHHSQQLLSQNETGYVFSIHVQHNFELEKEILSFGDGIKVIKPESLKRSIIERTQHSLDQYHTHLNSQNLKSVKRHLDRKGTATLTQVYTHRDIKKIIALMPVKENDGTPISGLRQLIQQIPGLKKMLFNENLKRLIYEIDPGAFLVKAIYFDKPKGANWFVPWHQDLTINLKERKDTVGFSHWIFRGEIHSVRPPIQISHNIITIRIHLNDTDIENGALQVFPGSHNKIFTGEELKLITEHGNSSFIQLSAGGVHLMKPLIIHGSARAKAKNKRRIIHLEFSSMELPNGLQWLEREDH